MNVTPLPSRRGRWLAGCFVLFGCLCFVPLAWAAVGFSEAIARDSRLFWDSLRWDSFEAFKYSLSNAPSMNSEVRFLAYSVVFIAVYALLLWQWIACFFRGWTLLRPHRIWAVTAAYFAVFMAFLQVFFFMPLIENTDPAVWWSWWFVLGCAFPLSFMTMAIRLWQITSERLATETEAKSERESQ